MPWVDKLSLCHIHVLISSTCSMVQQAAPLSASKINIHYALGRQTFTSAQTQHHHMMRLSMCACTCTSSNQNAAMTHESCNLQELYMNRLQSLPIFKLQLFIMFSVNKLSLCTMHRFIIEKAMRKQLSMSAQRSWIDINT